MTEPLHDCPKCGRTNFTARGLKAHACKPAAKAVQQPLKVIHAPLDDATIGAQLTAQYKLATNGMQQVVIFGAMMMQLREEHPELTKPGGDRQTKKALSKRGQCSEPEPLSLSKWLEKYAPEVKRTTALRFLNVTEAITQDYIQIVGKTTAKLISLPELVTTPAAQLPKGCESKQLLLFDWVNGTSQKSWLYRFSPQSPQKRGRDGRGDDKPRVKTAKELEQDAKDEITTVLMMLDAWFEVGHHNRVPSDIRVTADATLEEARKKLKAVK